MEPNRLKDLVLNVSRPYVIKHLQLPWKCFRTSFREWCEEFDRNFNAKVPFESCPVKNGRHPQWEHQRAIVELGMCEFHDTYQGEDLDQWLSYSYRSIRELPTPCREDIDFSAFGFPDVEEDISFWLSSKNAHTSCHYDTYGCNIIVQVYGKKSWLLFPPGSGLTPTRVPYEESSVYCKENFYSPRSYGELVRVESDAHHVVLEPGMALIVPPQWWHYVETLEPSLNFNTWLKLEQDQQEQISECLTKLVIQDICAEAEPSTLKQIINPNEISFLNENPESNFEILRYLVNQNKCGKKQRENDTSHPSSYLAKESLEQLVEESKYYVEPVRQLNSCEFFTIIKQNCTRFDPQVDREPLRTEEGKLIEASINACCNSDVIKSLKESIVANCLK